MLPYLIRHFKLNGIFKIFNEIYFDKSESHTQVFLANFHKSARD